MQKLCLRQRWMTNDPGGSCPTWTRPSCPSALEQSSALGRTLCPFCGRRMLVWSLTGGHSDAIKKSPNCSRRLWNTWIRQGQCDFQVQSLAQTLRILTEPKFSARMCSQKRSRTWCIGTFTTTAPRQHACIGEYGAELWQPETWGEFGPDGWARRRTASVTCHGSSPDHVESAFVFMGKTFKQTLPEKNRKWLDQPGTCLGCLHSIPHSLMHETLK